MGVQQQYRTQKTILDSRDSQNEGPNGWTLQAAECCLRRSGWSRLGKDLQPDVDRNWEPACPKWRYLKTNGPFWGAPMLRTS